MKQILITIDTEVGEIGGKQPDAFATFVEGKIGDQEAGVAKIMEILERHQARGEFFVDPYSSKQLGEEPFAQLCQSIIQRGHAVQLHTHPAFAFDPNRRYLADYTPTEQADILQQGVQMLTKWTGHAPLAHRAGGYGMNQAGITALEEVGIDYDSSYHHQNPHCQLPVVHQNAPYRIGKVWEIPVSGFRQVTRYTLFGLPLARRATFQKLDYRYGSSVSEILAAIDQAPDPSVQVLFLHSFNFLDLPFNTKRQAYKQIRILPELISQFDSLLETLASRPDYCFTGFRDLTLAPSLGDYCVTVTTKRPFFRKVAEIWQERFLHTQKT